MDSFETLRDKEPFDILPFELINKILSYLSVEELCKYSCCSKECRNRANSNQIWMKHCLHNGWLKYGLQQNLFQEQSRVSLSTNISHCAGGAPVVQFEALMNIPDGLDLSPVCKWKIIYLQVYNLKDNWIHGRYTNIGILKGHTSNISGLCCSDSLIASCSSDSTVILWDSTTGQRVKTIRLSKEVTAITNKGDTMVVSDSSGCIHVFNMSTGKLLHISQCSLSPVDILLTDGDVIIAIHQNLEIGVTKLKDGKPCHTLRGHADEIECSFLYHYMLLTGGWDKILILWDFHHGREITQFVGHKEAVRCCQFDEDKVVSGSSDCTLKIWTSRTGTCRRTLSGHTGDVYCLQYNKDVIVSGSSDSTSRVWDFSGECLHILKGHLGVVRCVYMDDYKLVTGGDQRKIIIWDYMTGEKRYTVHRHPTLLNRMIVKDTMLISSSPENPGTVTVLNYW